jgi:hypothetical protein
VDHRILIRWLLLSAGVVAGCSGSSSSSQTGGGGSGSTAGTDGGTAVTRTCSDLFDQSTLAAYAIDIASDQWAALTADFMNISAVQAGTPPQTYRPITFHYGSETVATAEIHLHGQSSWVQTVQDDTNPKMQFEISFDQIDPQGSFHGVKKLVFDMPRDDWTFLNERISDAWFRQIGIMAPCANSGTMTINGAYYGLYVTEESKGSQLIREFYPNDPNGDFLNGGVKPTTTDGGVNVQREDQFWNAVDITTLRQIMDLPNSLLEWAAEAILNDSDGYYGGDHNFYIYDEGAPGFVFIPTDVDSTLEWMSVFTSVGYQQHPIYWWNKPTPQPPGQQYLIVMNDPASRAQYAQAIATQLPKWNSGEIQGWINNWSSQIANAVAMDTHKWATVDQFNMAIATDLQEVTQRPTFLQSFVDCENGMSATDQDGDGVPWCNDCDDTNPAVHPGAKEICGNHIDDNCNGVVDEDCPGEVPQYPGETDGGPPATSYITNDVGDGGVANTDGGARD